MTNLLLLSSEFPFGDHETYLEAEIRYLAEGFDRVFVVPSTASGAARCVPEGVTVVDDLARHLRATSGRLQTCRGFKSSVLRFELLSWGWRLADPRCWRMVPGLWSAATRISDWLGDFLREQRLLGEPMCLYSYWFDYHTLGACLLKRRFSNVAVVTRAHGYDVYRDRRLHGRFPFRVHMLPDVDRIFVVSEHGRSHQSALFPRWRDRFRVSRLGVPDPRIVVPPSPDGHIRLCSCSWLAALKRVELLIRGLACFANQNPDRMVVWNHLGDGPERLTLERLARRSLPPNVQWAMTGQLTSREVGDFYRTHAVDGFINVSASEGLPVTFMEAMSCGISVIAPAVGGIPEIVNDSNGVLLSARCDAGEIADAISRITGAESARLRGCARDTWREKYSADTNYRSFVKQLQQIAAARMCNETERIQSGDYDRLIVCRDNDPAAERKDLQL